MNIANIDIDVCQRNEGAFSYSILIPTWNNLNYAQLCVQSIRECSFYNPQIILIINEGIDGTLEWVKETKDLDYIHAHENIGICYGLNEGRKLVRSPYLLYMNDDMVVSPDWDKALLDHIQSNPKSFVSASLVEPRENTNPNYVASIKNFGEDVSSMDLPKWYKASVGLIKADWSGASWPPSIVSIELWDKVGGYSLGYSPGMYSDPDFSMKLWNLGIRDFKGCGNSLVYHFGSKSTKRVKQNKGSILFFKTWGISARTFYTYFLKMGKMYAGELAEVRLPITEILRNRIKAWFV